MSFEAQNQFAGKLRSFSQTSRSWKLSLSATTTLNSPSLYLSSKTVVSCVCTCSPSPRLLSCSRLYLSFLCSRWPYGRRGSGPLLSLSLSLSDCAEGVFASYQIMLAKESRLYFSFRRWRCNYFQASLGAPYIRRLVSSITRDFGNAQALVIGLDPG